MEPYLYTLHPATHKRLFHSLGMKNEFSNDDYMHVIIQMNEEYKSNPLPQSKIEIVNIIINRFADAVPGTSFTTLFPVPLARALLHQSAAGATIIVSVPQ